MDTAFCNPWGGAVLLTIIPLRLRLLGGKKDFFTTKKGFLLQEKIVLFYYRFFFTFHSTAFSLYRVCRSILVPQGVWQHSRSTGCVAAFCLHRVCGGILAPQGVWRHSLNTSPLTLNPIPPRGKQRKAREQKRPGNKKRPFCFSLHNGQGLDFWMSFGARLIKGLE